MDQVYNKLTADVIAQRLASSKQLVDEFMKNAYPHGTDMFDMNEEDVMRAFIVGIEIGKTLKEETNG